MSISLVKSAGFVYLIPDTPVAHWIYLVGISCVLVCAYVLFMKKYYYLHEEYLMSLRKQYDGDYR